LINPVWSATTCDFPGAGVYLGLAPRHEHLIVARMLTPRQVRLFTGARAGVGRSPAPLEYYAVRDPSVVRVIPVSQPPLPNGFRHVRLAFQFEKPQLLADAVSVPRGTHPGEQTFAFLMSIGLPLAEEDGFYGRVALDSPEPDFAELYARLSRLAEDDKA